MACFLVRWPDHCLAFILPIPLDISSATWYNVVGANISLRTLVHDIGAVQRLHESQQTALVKELGGRLDKTHERVDPTTFAEVVEVR